MTIRGMDLSRELSSIPNTRTNRSRNIEAWNRLLILIGKAGVGRWGGRKKINRGLMFILVYA